MRATRGVRLAGVIAASVAAATALGFAVVGASSLSSSGRESTATELVSSDVDPDTPPTFDDGPQSADDVIAASDVDVAVFGVDPASVRLQGLWEGQQVYLGLSGISTVKVITGILGDPHSWGAGASDGNSVLGVSMSDSSGLQYLPQGTAEVPDGWVALSGSVIVLQ